MEPVSHMEIDCTIQDLQAAINAIEQVAAGIEKDCHGIESSRCVKYLRLMADNYKTALRGIVALV